MTVAEERKGTGVRGIKMDVKVLEENETTVKLILKNTTHAMVNAVRRSIMSGIPVAAIEDVHIYESTGVMFDEMLAARLGLTPLKMDTKGYKLGDKVKLVLEKEGPCTVYSKDIKSTDPKIEVAKPNIIITKLGENQKLKIEMDAVVGTGKQHSKWQPALASYIEMPTIKGEKGKSYKADVIETILDESQRDLPVSKGQIIEYDPTTFVFTVESHGNLTPKELFAQAIESIKVKSEDFRKELKNLS